MSGFHALVLAAGLGSRFGGRKLTSSWGDGLLIDGALRAALAAPVEKVWVTVGADPEVAAAAHRVAPAGRTELIPVPDFAAGLSASLRAGLAALPADADGALVFLGDMPDVPTEVLAPLVRAVEGGAPAAVPVHSGRRGHPVALARRLFPEIAALDGDRGAGAILDRLGPAVTRVETANPGVLFDVDYPGPKAVT